MSDMPILARPALAGVKMGSFGAVGRDGPRVRLSMKPRGSVLQVLGAPGVALAEDLAQSGAVRTISPGQWFVVGDESAGAEVLAARLGDRGAVIEQSHGRVRIGVSGTNAAELLAKGTAVDLGTFPTGRSTMTQFGHIGGVNLARLGEEAFELIVLRGFAESLWKYLVTIGLEYGVVCEGAAD